jgi:hypothetical protein
VVFGSPRFDKLPVSVQIQQERVVAYRDIGVLEMLIVIQLVRKFSVYATRNIITPVMLTSTPAMDAILS